MQMAMPFALCESLPLKAAVFIKPKFDKPSTCTCVAVNLDALRMTKLLMQKCIYGKDEHDDNVQWNLDCTFPPQPFP